ncbi:actin cytoskeleton-regulatory complex protein PAN1-like [Zingiber officinale]|uniref:actin cytoskeleton-regulatory complex protein PAN1-like n=1 Tax=Zingiber officinale TaxID=94328 RepID=UPI001C4ACFDD|nr:actin cytoskeleton-regulatory complex protein PAN1-like [Zingiber officinale]
MASRPDQVPDMRLFDAYFLRADVDRDGRISGKEAVTFFEGSNLPRPVLAQIWMYADQRQAGFLGREEFYNALRLVTVAQRGIPLTPETVQAALKTPDAAKIPAPKINTLPGPASQMNFAATSSPSPQMSGVGPTNQNPGLRTQPPLAHIGMSQHAFPSGNHLVRPLQTTPVAILPSHKEGGQVLQGSNSSTVLHPPGSVTPSISTDWFSGQNKGVMAHGTQQASFARVPPSVNQDGFGISNFGSTSRTVSKPQAAATTSISSNPMDSKALVLSENGFSSDSNLGGDVFSATQTKQEKPLTNLSANVMLNSSNNAPVISGSQNSRKVPEADSWHSMALVPSGENQLQPTQSQIKQNQLDMKQSTLAMTLSSGPVGSVSSTSTQPQFSWPKFTQSDIQSYLAIFIKVDKDRDGKITGEEARNLFLSWRLPREVLKQIWELSDQDNDSMLSLREFCIALYLMERHREKCPLPVALPNSVASDQTLLLATNQPWTGYGSPVSQSTPVQGMAMPQPSMPATVKPQMHKRALQSEDTIEAVQPKSRVPVLEKYLVDQLSKEEQSALNTKFQEASDADQKVQELEKEILESREKTEFYRSKMQELVLYKSRCDNRLNEVTERASADKQEVESLTKRYEQKCKQVGDVASKLTIEEATFRDIQDKKLEIYNAILKIEQGETTEGSLQARADHIQKDLKELIIVLNERSKQYGLRAKPTTLMELPFGWQPGIQEGAADWDEDWDKFEEDGFSVIKELTIEVKKDIPTGTPKPQVQNDELSTEEVQETSLNGEDKSVTTSLNAEGTNEKPHSSTTVELEPMTENGSTNLNSSETISKSPASPGLRTTENPKDGQAVPVRLDDSPRANENSSDHETAESSISEDKHAIEPSWGPTFDRSDDTDSVWSYNPNVKNSGPSFDRNDDDTDSVWSHNLKESDHHTQRKYSFGSDDFGLFPPIKTDSPSGASVVGKEKGPFFDSVPSTPMYNSSFSPRFSEGPDDHSFDSFSQNDYFGTHDTNAFGQRQSFARFDSFSSTTDFNRPDNLARLDSINSTIDPNRGGNFARFDSIRSTADYGGGFSSFDSVDLFGSGPFRSSDSQNSPNKGTTNWDAF